MAFDVARAPYLITRVYPWSDVVRAVRAACVVLFDRASVGSRLRHSQQHWLCSVSLPLVINSISKAIN